MKTNYLLLIAFISLIASACTQRVYLTVTEPPAVNVDKAFLRAGFINRTFAEGASQVLETIDNALSLEGDLDRKGSNAAVQGAYDYLMGRQRFEYLAILDSMRVTNGGINVFPAALSWDEVDQLCLENNVQFLIVLEMYDTDSKVSYSSGMTTKNNPITGGTIQVPVTSASMSTSINTGWRIYDPVNKLILDEFFVRDQMISTGSGINPVAAASVLLKRGQAVKQISTEVGRFYAGRIQAQNFRVWRNYFNKGSRNLKIAKRRSEVGDWDGAAEMWEKDLNSPKRKVAGRAHYNMAIYKEINGDVYGALEMAQKAYSDFNIKEGQVYANILRQRIQRIERDKALND